MGGNGRLPTEQEILDARARVGMGLVHLHPEDSTVEFAREGVMLDLGAIGKGYAIERAAEILRDAGVSSALLHGGTSTAYALGRPPEAEYWKVAIENIHPSFGDTPIPIPPLLLADEAMSVSALWGRSFQAEGKLFGHVLDPRTGHPAGSGVLAAVILPSATETDALSTALLTVGNEGHEKIANLRPGMRTVLVFESEGKLRVEATGIDS